MPCFVHFYDMCRDYFNPASTRKAPWQKRTADCHEVYYNHVLQKDKRAAYKDVLKAARPKVQKIINDISCGPILIRLAWHDSGTFDNNREGMAWPCAGGAIGSIIYDKEITAGPNAGLAKAIQYLKPVKEAHPSISWADLIQMGSAEAIKAMGGPTIPVKYGRMDASKSPDEGSAPFGLPDAKPPFGGPNKTDPAAHLRYVFYKYGMNDQEIVALSGAHTVGRAFKDRSGTVPFGYTNPTAYTTKGCPFMQNSLTNGGQSWTKEFLKFNNDYFQCPAKGDSQLVAFPTDEVLTTDAGFKPYFEKYGRDQEAFFVDYAAAHKKLSELGSKFDPELTVSGTDF